MAQARKRLLAGSADECSRKCKMEEAVELYTRAGEFGRALEIVNQQLGNQLGEPSAGPPNANPRVNKLLSQVGLSISI